MLWAFAHLLSPHASEVMSPSILPVRINTQSHGTVPLVDNDVILDKRHAGRLGRRKQLHECAVF